MLSIGSLCAECRLVYEPGPVPEVCLGYPPLDADQLLHLAQALSHPGFDIVRRVAAGQQSHEAGAAVPTAPGAIRVQVEGPLDELSDQQAAAAVLGSMPRLGLDWHVFTRFCEEAEAVQAGNSAGLWLLPALAHVSTLSVFPYRSDELHQLATALSTVLSHGYLPRLRCVLCPVPRFKLSKPKQVAFAQVLKACCVRLVPERGLSVAEIDRLRAPLDATPAPDSPTTRKLKGAAGRGSTGAGTHQQRAGETLYGEGRRLLQRLLC